MHLDEIPTNVTNYAITSTRVYTRMYLHTHIRQVLAHIHRGPLYEYYS